MGSVAVAVLPDQQDERHHQGEGDTDLEEELVTVGHTPRYDGPAGPTAVTLGRCA